MLIIKGIFRGIEKKQYGNNVAVFLCLEESLGDWEDFKIDITKIRVNEDYDYSCLKEFMNKDLELEIRAFAGKNGVGFQLVKELSKSNKMKVA